MLKVERKVRTYLYEYKYVCVCVFIGVHLYNRPKSCSYYLYTVYNNPIYVGRCVLYRPRFIGLPTTTDADQWKHNSLYYYYYRVHCGGRVVCAPEVGILESSGERVSGKIKKIMLLITEFVTPFVRAPIRQRTYTG